MNQSYGRLVSRAAIAATAMASLLLLIKIFAWCDFRFSVVRQKTGSGHVGIPGR